MTAPTDEIDALLGAVADTVAPLRAARPGPPSSSSTLRAVVHGDLDAPRTLQAAPVGSGQLFLNAGGAGPVRGPQPMIRQQVAAIETARSVGVEHIIKISVWRAAPGRALAEGATWPPRRTHRPTPVRGRVSRCGWLSRG